MSTVIETAVKELELKAIHESGHAVIRWHFKHPIESLELDRVTGPNEWQQSFSENLLAELAKRESLMEMIIVACAGRAAMDRFYGRKAQREDNWKASDDFQSAFSLALQLNDGDSEAAMSMLAWLQRRAELLVERNWPAIQRLGTALVERGKIKGTEISHIIRRV